MMQAAEDGPRSAIESEIGEKLEWNPNSEAIDKVIKLERTANLNDHDKWPEYVSWLVDRAAPGKGDGQGLLHRRGASLDFRLGPQLQPVPWSPKPGLRCGAATPWASFEL
jgi:hypothetical protein